MSLRCLITAGPTREFFDPVRYISNPSSGKMGFALAESAQRQGWVVDLVHGPVAIKPPAGVNAHAVVTCEEMYAVCGPLFSECDLLIMCAAVCDMRPKIRAEGKVKKGDLSMTVEFEPTRDILKTLSAARRPEQTLVGFAAETDDVENYARKKLEAKNLDWIVANSVAKGGAFESDTNKVSLIGRAGEHLSFGPDSKAAVADWIIEQIAKLP
ncbi:phosphopantothenoylcysteine decarboxylase [Rubellicoccus peritrichatus]|uniref:Phosphopantothenoylcysteine decarboxylase n=1 Tax=Rubellicoccus peritrichatus TaxID=3080537 RepID=A0AAQ3LJS3_9BACT|nr:phosphopantothenoylcysteine decarboxylase [Puniceicoccus sp. CR14]WOO43519.1 phosphopantothenoylcysteine decarboxylase [Puniceicoccus sp. CR14]